MDKSELVDPALSGVAETLLIPHYNRAMETRTDSRVIRRMV
jgi:O-methyltransferase involved in polyketide biosynthesis